VRAAATRCGPQRTGATGLEPAASGVTERRSATRIPCKNAGRELFRSLCRHLFTLRSRPLRAAGAANPTGPSLDRGHTSVILLCGSDRLMSRAVGVQGRCPRSPLRARRARPDAIRRWRARRRRVVVFVISCPPARRPCGAFRGQRAAGRHAARPERERAASGRDPAPRRRLLGLLHEYSLRQASRSPATARDEPRGDSKRDHHSLKPVEMVSRAEKFSRGPSRSKPGSRLNAAAAGLRIVRAPSRRAAGAVGVECLAGTLQRSCEATSRRAPPAARRTATTRTVSSLATEEPPP
jgi:hypothetical protein